MVNRRDALKIVTASVASLVIGLGAGYGIASRLQGRETPTLTTPTTTSPVSVPPKQKKIKALWIYVGPIGDYGWTHAHHIGKENASKILSEYVEAKHIERVGEDVAYSTIKAALKKEEFNAVFATSFGFMDAIKMLAAEYPEIMFYHCSGPWEEFVDLPNVITYFAEFYQLYYLNGIAAGAVTNTCKVGYVPAFLIPEVVRHINAFAIGAEHGAKLLGKCGNGRELEVYVTAPLRTWFDPNKARSYAETLINQYNVDVVAYTEDSTAVLEVAAEYNAYSFSHYSNMLDYFVKQAEVPRENIERIKRAHLTGQVADWTPIHVYLLSKLVTGIAEKEDVWARIGDFTQIRWKRPTRESTAGSPEGAVYLAPLNTEVIPAKAIEYIKELYEDMKEYLFDPFTGPLEGYTIDPASGKKIGEIEVKVPRGVRWGRNELWGVDTMNWYYKNIITLGG